MGKRTTRTAITSRGRLNGVVRDELPAGTGQNRTSRVANRDAGGETVDEALFYRARLILGDDLPRPGR
ncbi:MAG: hypothetical protein ACM3NV_08605 [Syntrophothermus sp.]